jgi:transposase
MGLVTNKGLTTSSYAYYTSLITYHYINNISSSRHQYIRLPEVYNYFWLKGKPVAINQISSGTILIIVFHTSSPNANKID